MRTIRLRHAADFAEWRDAARMLLLGGVAPHEVDWRLGEGLFEEEPAPRPVAPSPRVPPSFLELAEAVICHSDPARFELLYRMIARLQVERQLLLDAMDPDVVAARRLEKSVRRDAHKMTAFVRFRETSAPEEARRRFVAWFEPEHHIVGRTAPFFARRFADMDWMILTPKGSASLSDGALAVSEEPTEKPDLADPTDALWLTYYRSIFNPARVKVKAMLAEMPKKYWANLPEAKLIPEMIQQAPARVADMAEQALREAPAFHARLQARQPRAEAPAPAGSLAALREEARTCTRCPLHCQATQTVFGEGPERAPLMIVGEQPGDEEDLEGRPFVGPAGQLFDGIARQAGLDRSQAYVTNAVKHFKYELRGKRRIHQSPSSGEIEHCRWWLKREIALVQPRLVVAMGRTAVTALTGKAPKLMDLRGRIHPLEPGRAMLVTVHPSYLLRLPDAQARDRETLRFRDDLAAAQDWIRAPTSSPAR